MTNEEVIIVNKFILETHKQKWDPVSTENIKDIMIFLFMYKTVKRFHRTRRHYSNK